MHKVFDLLLGSGPFPDPVVCYNTTPWAELRCANMETVLRGYDPEAAEDRDEPPL
jgi:hypothetical protein